MFALLEATLSCSCSCSYRGLTEKSMDQQRPEVGYLPWSSFRPNKGTLGRWGRVGGGWVYCKALQGNANNRVLY